MLAFFVRMNEAQLKMVKRYGELAVKKRKIGQGPETIDGDLSFKIEKEMSDIRKSLGLGHITILPLAAAHNKALAS